jgi:uncharacterized membrane protein SirB2
MPVANHSNVAKPGARLRSYCTAVAVISISAQWLTLGIVAFIAFRGLGLSYRDLGIRVPRPLDWPIALVTLVIALIAAAITTGLFPFPDSAN